MNVWPLLLALVLVGCSEAPAENVPAKPLPLTTPTPRIWHFDSGELMVIDVPVASTPRRIETQTCFIWRDREFKVASLQCPADTGEILSPGQTQDLPHY